MTQDPEDVVVISDDEVEDESTVAAAAPEAPTGPAEEATPESKGRKDSKLRGVAKVNHEMALGITSAFSQGRAVYVVSTHRSALLSIVTLNVWIACFGLILGTTQSSWMLSSSEISLV